VLKRRETEVNHKKRDAVAFDAATNFYRRYFDFARSPAAAVPRRWRGRRSEAHRARIPAGTTSAAPRTGCRPSPDPVSRCSCGGATRIRS
jgi:hypothetical protein